MKYCIIIIMSIFCFSCKINHLKNENNYTYVIDSISKKKIYTFVEQMPEYRGGMVELLQFILSNFDYPKQDIFQAEFILEMIIDENGIVTEAKIYNKKEKLLSPAERELIRIVNIMPAWIPGKHNGENVNVKLCVPLQISPLQIPP